MAVLNLQVGDGTDDGIIQGASIFSNNATFTAVGFTGAGITHGFFRFTNVTIPKNSTINSATLTFRAQSSQSGATCNAVIDAHAANNPSAPTTYNDVATAPRTSANVSWSNIGAWTVNNNYNTPSIAPVIQELVNRSGWVSGDALVIFVNDDSSSSGAIRAMYTYEGSPSGAAKLTIDYTPPNTAPTITVSPSVNYNGYTRLGPSNTPGSVGFTATDPEETGTDELTVEVRTAASGGGTLVATDDYTSGTSGSISIAHNASGLSEGSNTLYMRVGDGTDWSDDESFTLLVDRTQPASFTPSHDPDPVQPDKQYTVSITANDSHSTGTSELFVEVRTGSGGTGTQLWSGNRTASATPFDTGTITDSALAHGSNPRYVRVIDGAGNVREVSFTVTAELIFDKFPDGDAAIDVTGDVDITASIPADGDAELDAQGDVVIGTTFAGNAAIDVTGTLSVEIIEFRDGSGDAAIDATGLLSLETAFQSDAAIDATGDVAIDATLSTAADAAIDVTGTASIGPVLDGTTAIDATGTTSVGPVLDADAEIDAAGDVSIDAETPASGDAAIDATGDVALVADTPLSGDAEIQATGNLDIELVGFEIRGHRLRAEFYDANGDPIGAGPVLDIISASYSLTLNEIGTWKLVIPATLPIAGQIIAGSRLKLYREGEGLIYQGIVHTPRIVVPESGEYTLEITGDSVARELVWRNTLFGLEFSNEPIDDVVDDLVTGTGWAADTETDARNLTIQYNAASIWRATVHAAETFGWHVRENNLDRTIDVGPMGDPSGLVLQNVTHIEDEMGVVPIRSLALASEQADLWNRVVPVGGGDGINVLTLRYSNRTGPYTIQSDTGPDGQTYWYIEDTTSIAAHGERTMPLSFPDVVPLSNSDAEIRNAANALYDIAAAWLGWHATAYETYEVEIGGIRHYDDNGDPLIQVGDTVRLVYRGLAVDESGETYVWKDIDTNVYVIALERAFSPGDLNAWKLTVSTSSQQAPGDAEAMAQAIDDLWAVQTSKRPYTYREIHGPYVESVDGSNDARFLVDFDSNVTYLHSATLRVRKRRVKSNVTGAASGGGATSSSGGGQTTSSGGGATSSSGGGQTTSGGSAHSHSVSGQTIFEAGGHGHWVARLSSTESWDDPTFRQQLIFSSTSDPDGVFNFGVYVGRGGSGGTDWLKTDTFSNHTHTISGVTSTSESSHTHTVSNHTHTVPAHTHTVSDHTHTVPNHTHDLVYGIYLGPTASSPAISLEINGADVTSDLGGPWNADFVVDITPYLVDSNGHVLRQANNLDFSAAQLCDLEVTVRSMVTAHSIVPV